MPLCDRCGDCLELVPNCTCDRDHLDWSAFGIVRKPKERADLTPKELPDGSFQVAA